MLISTTSGETFHTIYNTNQKNINRPIYNLRPHIVRPVLSTRLLWLLFQVCKMVIQAKRVSNCYIPKKKMSVCSTNLGFSVGTYYVPDTYVPGISRQKSTRTYVMFQIRNTYVPGISRQKSIRTYVMFRPWTHTSDDSYIYQLSLVVATATVSLYNETSTTMILQPAC